MSSAVTWEAVNLYSRLHKLLCHYPLYWSSQERRFYEESSLKKLTWWFFLLCSILVVGGGSMILAYLELVSGNLSKHSVFTYKLLYLAVTIFFAFIYFVAIIIFTHRRLIAINFNRTRNFESMLRSGETILA